ncbi:hypothetical protein L2K20_29040 [Mycobacterium sp. MBM]|nr:hypothetical protein [Mycobacterium sp. MBM]
MTSLSDRSISILEWVSLRYRPASRPFAALRIVFAVYVLLWPRRIDWISGMSLVPYAPPPGPFSLLPGPAPHGAIVVLEVLRVILALCVLVGWNSRVTSGLLSLVLMICSGLAYSYGKVDHVILYDLAPMMLGLAGWGSTWSVDSWRRRAAATNGYPMLLYGTMIAFGMLTAAVAKSATGWLDPARQATRFFVAEAANSQRSGVLSDSVLTIDNVVFWKFLDYTTLVVEGGLVVAVFIPILFRVGLLVMGIFHVGVWALLGIDFHQYAFVYLGFFLIPVAAWHQQIGEVQTWVLRMRKILARKEKTLGSQ